MGAGAGPDPEAQLSTPVLTQQDLEHMHTQGYVVVKNAVPKHLCAAVVDGIWEHLGYDRDCPETWYSDPHGDNLKQDGFMRQVHTPAMWDTRQSPRVHRAFADLWGTEKLWVCMDRCAFKPPKRLDKPGWGVRDQKPYERWGTPEQQRRGLLHWDVPVADQPARFQMYQACLFLEDTRVDQGAFQCVPGAHRWYEDWHAERRASHTEVHNAAPHETRFEPQRMRGDCGDLLIWDSFLPHGATANTSTRPRMAQVSVDTGAF
jgi:hypothetical protein